MNKLTQEEFQLRLRETSWAKEIFIDTKLTKDISLAYEAYCKVFDKQVEILTTKNSGNRPPALFDNLNRPTCPVCNKGKLMLRQIPPNQTIKIQLVCEDPKCDTVLNSLDNIKTWIDRMSSTESIDVSGLERVSKRAPIPGRKYTWLSNPCPVCGQAIYEMDKCCGAPEGLIECSKCDFQEVPSKFYAR